LSRGLRPCWSSDQRGRNPKVSKNKPCPAQKVAVKNPKKTRPGWNDPRACASFPQPVIPPAPLTGDAGRGCGDASCAPNFCLMVLVPERPRRARISLKILDGGYRSLWVKYRGSNLGSNALALSGALQRTGGGAGGRDPVVAFLARCNTLVQNLRIIGWVKLSCATAD
jgi:hypothetical protein